MARPAAAVLGLCLTLAAQVSAAGEKPELLMYATIFEGMASKAKLDYSTPWNAECVKEEMARIMYAGREHPDVSEAMRRAREKVPKCCTRAACGSAAEEFMPKIEKLLKDAVAEALRQRHSGRGAAGQPPAMAEAMKNAWQLMLKPKLQGVHGAWLEKCDAGQLDERMPKVLERYLMKYGMQHRFGNDNELHEATKSSCGVEMPVGAVSVVREQLEGMVQGPPARLWAMPRVPLLGRAAQPGSGFYVAAVAAVAAIAAGAFLAGKRAGERRGTPMLEGVE